LAAWGSRRPGERPRRSRAWSKELWAGELALLRQLDAACDSADDLAQAVAESFEEHPDAEIITGFPGLSALSGARVFAEIGDDRSRFADAKGHKAYAGSAPITRASGKDVAVLARRVKNQRLAAVGPMHTRDIAQHLGLATAGRPLSSLTAQLCYWARNSRIIRTAPNTYKIPGPDALTPPTSP